MTPGSLASRYRIRGGWILTCFAGTPVATEAELTELTRTIIGTNAERASLEFLAPRATNKKLISFNSREDLGVKIWNEKNAVVEVVPHSQAAQLQVRPGWILLSLNGKPLSQPARVALSELHCEAGQQRRGSKASGRRNLTAAIFNTASDDIKRIRLNSSQISGIRWKVVNDNEGCVDASDDPLKGDLVVHTVDPDLSSVGGPKPGWRPFQIETDNRSVMIRRPQDIESAFMNAKNSSRHHLDILFDASDEEPDLEIDVQAERERTKAEKCINPSDLPVLPLVEACIYLHLARGVDLVNYGRPPYIRIFWCGKEVGRSKPGQLSSNGQPFWKRGTESFLLPMPFSDNELSAIHGDDVKQFPPPMIAGDVDDAELLLEVWTSRPAPLGPICHGQVLLQGTDLLRQCYTIENDDRAKRPMTFKLMPHSRRKDNSQKDASKQAALATQFYRLFGKSPQRPAQGALKIMLFLLHPGIGKAECAATENGCVKQGYRECGNLKSSAASKPPLQLDIEISTMMSRIVNGSAKDRQEAIIRLASLALSGQSEIARHLIALGAAPAITLLLSQTCTPDCRRNAAAACRGIMRDGGATSRETLLAAGVLTPLLRLSGSQDPQLGDAAAEALAALAETVDRGNTQLERQAISLCSELVELESSGCGSDKLIEVKSSLSQLLERDLLESVDVQLDCSSSTLNLSQHIPLAVVDEILRTITWYKYVYILRHGSYDLKKEAARVLAAIAGTELGAERLMAECAADLDNANIVSTIFHVTISGPKHTPDVKSDCLRVLCRMVLQPNSGNCAKRREELNRAGARSIIGTRLCWKECAYPRV